MAAAYDKEEMKRIWPPILVPQTFLDKYAEMNADGNRKKALKGLHDTFGAESDKVLADLIANTDAAYPEWKAAADAAKAAQAPPAKAEGKGKKAAATADGTPTETGTAGEEVVGETTGTAGEEVVAE